MQLVSTVNRTGQQELVGTVNRTGQQELAGTVNRTGQLRRQSDGNGYDQTSSLAEPMHSK